MSHNDDAARIERYRRIMRCLDAVDALLREAGERAAVARETAAIAATGAGEAGDAGAYARATVARAVAVARHVDAARCAGEALPALWESLLATEAP